MGEAAHEIPPSELQDKAPEAANENGKKLESGEYAVDKGTVEAAAALAERSAEAGASDAAAVAEAEATLAKMGFKELSSTNVEAGGDENAKLEAEISELQTKLSGMKTQGAARRFFSGANRQIKHLETLIDEKQTLLEESKALAGMSEQERANRRRANTIRAIR